MLAAASSERYPDFVSTTWLEWLMDHWQAVGGIAGLSTGAAMLTRPRLRLMLSGGLGGAEDDAAPDIVYQAEDGRRVLAGAIFVRAFVWNYGMSVAEDCTVSVDRVWKDGALAPDHRYLRFPLKWTMIDAGAERFAPRKLLPGKANGYRVDVCKVDGVNPTLQILSEASHAPSGRHRYADPGVYAIELVAQSSSFWATPARCTIVVEYTRTDDQVGLFILAANSRRSFLRIV